MNLFLKRLAGFHLRYWNVAKTNYVENISLVLGNAVLFTIVFGSEPDSQPSLPIKLLLAFAAISVTYMCAFVALLRPGTDQSVSEEVLKLASFILLGWLLAQCVYLPFVLTAGQDGLFGSSEMPYCFRAMLFTTPVAMLAVWRTVWVYQIDGKAPTRLSIWGRIKASLWSGSLEERFGLVISIAALFVLNTLLFDLFLLNKDRRPELIELVKRNASHILPANTLESPGQN